MSKGMLHTVVETPEFQRAARTAGITTQDRNRVVTAYADTGTPVFLLSMFAKGDRIDLSAAERNELRQIIGRMIDEYRKSQTGTRR